MTQLLHFQAMRQQFAPTIRAATGADLPGILEIYAAEVAHGTATFEDVPPSLAELGARHAAAVALGCPYLVADCGGRIAGFAYAGSFRARSGFRTVVESTVYVAPHAARSGVGRALMERVIEECAGAGFQQMVAVIGGDNEASIAFHATLGFHVAGRLERVGYKFGRWLPVTIMQRALGGAEPDQK